MNYGSLNSAIEGQEDYLDSALWERKALTILTMDNPSARIKVMRPGIF